MTGPLPHDIPITPDLVRGAVELEYDVHGLLPHRLPAHARAQSQDPQVSTAELQPSGVRLVLRTRATAVELETMRTRVGLRGAPRRPDGVYDQLVDGELAARASTSGGFVRWTDPVTGATETETGPRGTLRFEGLPDRDKVVEIWLPHNETTEVAAMRTDAPVAPVPVDRPVWLHHGSSISAGSNAASPSTTWPALAARAGGVALVNLGFSGRAMVDPFTARTMRDTPADLLSVKLGINVVNGDVMRRRVFGPAVHGFLDTVRDGHPTTPLVLVSPVLCPIHEDTPGPGAVDMDSLAAGTLRFRATGDPAEVPAGRLTLTVVREDLRRVAVSRRDPNLYYLDGRELYGDADAAELPLPDNLHPDAATHELIGARFAAYAFGPGGPFHR